MPISFEIDPWATLVGIAVLWVRLEVAMRMQKSISESNANKVKEVEDDLKAHVKTTTQTANLQAVQMGRLEKSMENVEQGIARLEKYLSTKGN